MVVFVKDLLKRSMLEIFSRVTRTLLNRSCLYALSSMLFFGVLLPVLAQDATLTGASNYETSPIVEYPAVFFERYKPSTALDMVRQVPGFLIDDGDASRGFAGAAGNLLINGQFPSANRTNRPQYCPESRPAR